MAKRHEIKMTVVSDIPGVTGREIVTAITTDLNARGILLESISIEEVKRDHPSPNLSR